jgi:hypothetical protein
VLDGRAMRSMRTFEVLTAAKIQLAVYADAQGTGAGWTEVVVIVKSEALRIPPSFIRPSISYGPQHNF